MYIVHSMNIIESIEGVDSARFDAANQVMQSLEKLIHAHETMEESRAKKLGLNLAEARYILFFDGGKRLTVKKLSNDLGLVKSRITRITDGMVEKGLVERIPDPDDGRGCFMRLTAKGEEVLYNLKQCCWEAYEKLLGDMSYQKRMMIVDVLSEFTGCLEDVSDVVVMEKRTDFA